MRHFQHRGIWYVELDGKRRSLKTRDKAEAKRLFNQIKKEWLAGKLAHLTGECRKTLKEFRQEFIDLCQPVQPKSTFRANRLAIDVLMKYAGEEITLEKLSVKHLDEMAADYLRKGRSITTVNIYIRHARTALNQAVKWGDVTRNPFLAAKELPNPKIDAQPEFMTLKEIAKFLNHVGDVDLRRMLVAYLATGRRRSELLNLEWKDVDLEEKQYYVRKTKRNLCRWYAINSMFMTVLESIPHREDGRVFRRWQHPDTISHYVKAALKKAGLGHLHLHHLRHTFASLQVLQGRDIRTLQELLGHKDYRTTLRYTHLVEEHVRKATEINLVPVDLFSEGRSKSTPKNSKPA